MKKISCVVMVDYYHKYMKTSLNITSKYNHIYLSIGKLNYPKLDI